MELLAATIPNYKLNSHFPSGWKFPQVQNKNMCCFVSCVLHFAFIFVFVKLTLDNLQKVTGRLTMVKQVIAIVSINHKYMIIIFILSKPVTFESKHITCYSYLSILLSSSSFWLSCITSTRCTLAPFQNKTRQLIITFYNMASCVAWKKKPLPEFKHITCYLYLSYTLVRDIISSFWSKCITRSSLVLFFKKKLPIYMAYNMK